ncbi:glycoside hydrolase family 13 protein [Rhodoglobus vestalii]|nr:alpha-amylase family glycosyl hydrolase [Rhodoglobus vestalii]
MTSVLSSSQWWRSAVIYQIYPRSFADSNGDGMGDLLGIRDRLPELAELGIDAVWLSPFYTSPQRDAGYDVADYCDVDPLFGTLDDFDSMTARAHELGLRVIVDLVPNHSSSAHLWFQEALLAAPGSEERARYMFRDGRGDNGELPPNNWESVFGGRAWTRTETTDGTPGQWYLHLFDSSQPDFDWNNPWVRHQFENVLRFWLDRGVDGFRVDVAHGMIKADDLPDWSPPSSGGSMGGAGAIEATEPTDGEATADQLAASRAPFWGQDGVHEIYRQWRTILNSYDGERILAAEAWVDPLTDTAKWVRPDEMHQAFNFAYLETPWAAGALRTVIDASISAFSEVDAPSTWVLSNHDVVRHASRLALTAESPQGHGIGPHSAGLPDRELGLRRARAATALMLALPGSAYIYQGEELGLPEMIALPDNARQDPTWFRTNGERYGRDGCRVPIPWEAESVAYGFSASGASWLPQPADWAPFARNAQRNVSDSTLTMYTQLLALRRAHELATGELEWLETPHAAVLALRNSDVLVYANTGHDAVPLPTGEVLLSSGPLSDEQLPADTTVWLRAYPLASAGQQ